MSHSLTFGETNPKNTWTNWHLIPSTRPHVAPPSVNEKMVEIPGRNGLLDCTTYLTGNPTYANRTGSWQFYVDHEQWNSWVDTYTEILQYLHGKRMRVVLEDDPNYYYMGRFSVENWSSGKDYSQITIKYNLDPYKTHISNGTTSL